MSKETRRRQIGFPVGVFGWEQHSPEWIVAKSTANNLYTLATSYQLCLFGATYYYIGG